MRTLLDTLLSVAALALLSPLLAAIALVIIIDSPGNPFYLAVRIGKAGRPFRMLKFRTMIKGAAQLGPPITGRNDPRMTRIGRFLRSTKFDELPQFINVILGDMSLVGPRPEALEIVALYTKEQRSVLAVKPGVTGTVQLASGEESETIPEAAKADAYYVQHLMERKLRSDLEYIRTRTFRTDIQILLATALFVLRSFARKLTETFL